MVHLVEYGCLNSQSATLMPEIAEHWSKIGYEGAPHVCMTYADGPGADFRPIMFQCEAMTHETSSPHFNSFVSKPFAAQIVPPKSIDVGYSLMDLHCRHTASAAGISAASAAHRELLEFLRTRAVEFRTGGLLVLAFIQRQEDSKTHQPNKLERSTGPKDTSSAPLAPLLPIDRSARTQQGIIVDGVVEPALPPDPFSARGMSSHTRAQSALSPIVARHWREETVRTRSDSTPYRSSTVPIGAKRGDVWSSIPALLAPCIQRLVSMGYIKSDAAHRLLSVSGTFCRQVGRALIQAIYNLVAASSTDAKPDTKRSPIRRKRMARRMELWSTRCGPAMSFPINAHTDFYISAIGIFTVAGGPSPPSFWPVPRQSSKCPRFPGRSAFSFPSCLHGFPVDDSLGGSIRRACRSIYTGPVRSSFQERST